jgi:RHS Repeat
MNGQVHNIAGSAGSLRTSSAFAASHMCGTFLSLQVFSYDTDGRLKEQLTYQFRSLGKRVYDYDSEGRPRAVLLYKNGLLLSTIQYGYDDWGRLSEQLELAGQGTNRKKTTYDYDERGRLATERFTNRLDASLDAISTYI